MSDEQRPTSQSHALLIAQMWAKVPPEHLEVALKALEPELQREHEHRLAVLQQQELRQDHMRYMCGLWAGFAIAVGMLAGAVFVGLNGQPWLAALLTGPSLLALAKLFVIRRADATDTRHIARAQQDALTAAPTNAVPQV